MIRHPTLHADFPMFDGWLIEPEQQNDHWSYEMIAAIGFWRLPHGHDQFALGTWEVQAERKWKWVVRYKPSKEWAARQLASYQTESVTHKKG